MEGPWESQSQEEVCLESGEEQPIDWDAAKRELRNRAE